MKRFLQKRFLWTLTSLVVVMTLALPWVVFAETVEPDNDLVTAGNQTFVNLGNVSPRQVLYPQVSFTLECAGNHHVDNGQSVTVGYTTGGSTVPTGGSMSATPATIGPIPAEWPDDNNKCPSPAPTPLDDSGNSTVTITAPTAPGTYTYTAKYGSVTLTPPGGNDSASVTGTVMVTFQLTVVSDTTPPVITPSVVGTLGDNGWYVSNVTVSWTVSDPESAYTIVEGCGTTTIDADTAGTTLACTAISAGGTNSQSVTIMRDATAPTISGAPSPAANAHGWNNTAVTVSFTCGDNLSGVASCGPNQTLTGDGAGQSVTGTAVDNAGNSASATVSGINIDKTPPTFGDCPSGGPFLLNSGWQSVGPIEADAAISGLDAGLSTLSGSVDTSSIGTKNVTFTAVDNAGNEATQTCQYSVIYNWNGFLRPVDNLPTFNVAKAGSAIPVKFSLSGYQGLYIFAAVDPGDPGYPQSKMISCQTSALLDQIEETVTAGQSSLSYDPIADQYVYVWKTVKGWAGTCRQLVVLLNDGTYHRANFNFNK
jgi:hypothetical protein